MSDIEAGRIDVIVVYKIDRLTRCLAVNDVEAAVVRRVFEEMLTLGSPTRIPVGLNAEGVTTKAWTTQGGQHRPGRRIDKKYLHKLLRNRIYLGELSHKGAWFAGVHPAIIDASLWDRVHAVLARDARSRAADTKLRSRTDALRRGLLHAPGGERMYPTYTCKGGRQYRCYVSRAESRFGAGGKTCERLTAAEVEAATVAQLQTVLHSPEAIAAVCLRLKETGAPVDEARAVMWFQRHPLPVDWQAQRGVIAGFK